MQRFLFFLLMAALSGCHKVTMKTTAPVGKSHYENGMFFFWGLVGDASIDLQKVCPSGVARIQQRQDVSGVLIGVVTLGVVLPYTFEINCQSQSSAGLFSDPHYPLADGGVK